MVSLARAPPRIFSGNVSGMSGSKPEARLSPVDATASGNCDVGGADRRGDQRLVRQMGRKPPGTASRFLRRHNAPAGHSSLSNSGRSPVRFLLHPDRPGNDWTWPATWSRIESLAESCPGVHHQHQWQHRRDLIVRRLFVPAVVAFLVVRVRGAWFGLLLLLFGRLSSKPKPVSGACGDRGSLVARRRAGRLYDRAYGLRG